MPGTAASAPPLETDCLVIGAGPVGLYQVFQLGLLGVHCTVIDARWEAGGQPSALYPDKPIYDLPGIPVCTGAELTERLRTQIQPFAPHLLWGQQVVACARQSDGRWLLTTQPVNLAGPQSGVQIRTQTVVIAAGVGAFVPKRLPAKCLQEWEGQQVFYHPATGAHPKQGHVLVVGGDVAAVSAAILLAAHATAECPVTLLHRRDQWDVDGTMLQALETLEGQGVLQRVVGQIQDCSSTNGNLTGVLILQPNGTLQPQATDVVLVYLGLNPRLGPLTEWGMDMDRKLLAVDPANCSTSLPGVFAVGDVVSYPGKKKLLVSGFQECVQAAFAAVEYLSPHAPPALEYTSSSSRLQKRLGVG